MLKAKSEQILIAIRRQFSTKLAGVVMIGGAVLEKNSMLLDTFMRDLANNIAQGLDEPELDNAGTEDVDYRDLLMAKLRTINMNAWLESEAAKLGNESQRERYLACELPEEDLLGLARDEVFQPFSRFTKWQPLKWSAVEHMPWCKPSKSAHPVELGVTTLTEDINDNRYASMVEVAAMLAQYHPWFMKSGTSPNIEIRQHTAKCKVCGDEIVALSALVTIPWAGRLLSREYAL